MTSTENISEKKRGRDGCGESRQVRGSASSAKVKVKGKADFTEGQASKNSPNHSSKNKSYSQKHEGKKYWQGHKGQQHDGQKSHYQSSTINNKGSPKDYRGGKYIKMYFINTKSDVNKCFDDYCRHELAILRGRNPKLASRTILFIIDGGEAASIKVEDIMTRHGAVYKKTLAYIAEQDSLIERVWGTIGTMARAVLADAKLPEMYWEEANRYTAFLYNHLPPHGKGADGRPRKSPQGLFYDMGPSLILHHIRPFGVWCYAYVAAQVRKHKHGKIHTEWGSRVRFMGFED